MLLSRVCGTMVFTELRNVGGRLVFRYFYILYTCCTCCSLSLWHMFFLWKINVCYSGFCFRVNTRSAGTCLCAVTMKQLLGPGLTNCLPICIGDMLVLTNNMHCLTLMLCYLVFLLVTCQDHCPRSRSCKVQLT
jgi:hypothetical protein